MQEIWKRIENWLELNAPDILADLLPPATETEIREAEAYLKISFPPEIRSSFLVHNGQKGDEGKFLIDGWQLLSLEQILEEWDYCNDLLQSGDFSEVKSLPRSNRLNDDWWHPHWLPLARSSARDYYCLDLNPSSAGNPGQIITFWYDMPERELVAPDFYTWLSNFAALLEGGNYIVAEEYDGLVLKD